MKTIIHYLKTRALKQIAQWLVVATCSILILGAFAVADAYAAFTLGPKLPTFPLATIETYQCADLAGSTAGTCNIDEGCMDFDYDDVNGDSEPDTWAAEICGPNTAYVDDELQPFELHGWIWDTNLGYVSLSCDSSGQNNGADCGSIEYGVKVDLATGEMSGWAWSDNMGWISFMCEGGLNEGYSCGSIDYSTSIDTTIGEELGVISGYAWADTVGWFDFETGDVYAKMLDLMMRTSASATPWGVWTKAEVEDDDLTDEQKNMQPTKDTMPVAGTGDGYDIFVNVADIAGSPIEDGGDIDLDIVTNWEDSVGYDQVSGENVNHDTENGHAVRKPGIGTYYDLAFIKSKATSEGIEYAHHGVIFSSMPTDGGNCYDGDGDGSCYTGDDNFFYKDFREETAPANTVDYLGADVTLTIPATGESWTATVFPVGYPGGWRMDFLPHVDIPVFDYLATPGDPSSAMSSIAAIRNKTDEFVLDGQENVSGGSYTVTLTLDSGTEDVDYVFIEDSESNPEDGESTLPPITNINDLDGTLLAFPFAPDEALETTLPGASLHSMVDVGILTPGPTNPRYYSNGLPRGENSEVQSQAAEILSGSVFSPGATEAVQGSDVPLFGDTAVYELRTAILEDVSSLIRGANFDDVIATSVTLDNGATPESLYKNSFKNGQFYYFENQDVTVQSLDPLIAEAGGNPITITVKGGDLYIRNNIDYPEQEVGFIVFESDDDPDQATKGGRMYVHSSITDMVNVHIFTDGPIFRYTDSVCYFTGTYGPTNNLTGLREPNFVEAGRCPGTFEEPVTALSNQFYLKGNIASFNCLGCSKDIQPSRGDGLIIGGPSAVNYAIARLYDFNYFSYYREDPLNPGSFSGDASNNLDPATATQTNAVYFEYSPAPTDLLGFRNF